MNCVCPIALCNRIFLYLKIFNFHHFLWHFSNLVVEESERGNTTPSPARKGGENMNVECLQWQARCEFNAYCRNTIRNELVNARKEMKRRRRRRGFLCRRFENHCPATCSSIARFAGRKKGSNTTILLFQYEWCRDCKTNEDTEKHGTASQYKLFWKVKTFFGGMSGWMG